MSAVPPELPEVSGRSRARRAKGRKALPFVTLGAAAHLLAAKAGFRLQLPGVRSRSVRTRLAANAVLSEASRLRYFSRSVLFRSYKNSTGKRVCQSEIPAAY